MIPRPEGAPPATPRARRIPFFQHLTFSPKLVRLSCVSSIGKEDMFDAFLPPTLSY